MESVNGKVAVVTGGASGIGLAMAQAFAREGARVVIADIEQAALDAAVATLPDGALAVRTDVPDLADVEQLAAATLERFGQVDVVCNNAGVSTFNALAHQSIEDWRWVVDVNLWGVVHGVHTFLPIMRRQGTPAHVVNTASVAGLLSGLAFCGPYAATKVAVVSISETLRQELAIEGAPIGVSVLCPSATNTNIMDAERNRPAGLAPERREAGGEAWRQGVRSTFTGATGKEPDEVAQLVVDAVRAERFWVISHGGERDAYARRFAEILDATPVEEPS